MLASYPLAVKRCDDSGRTWLFQAMSSSKGIIKQINLIAGIEPDVPLLKQQSKIDFLSKVVTSLEIRNPPSEEGSDTQQYPTRYDEDRPPKG